MNTVTSTAMHLKTVCFLHLLLGVFGAESDATELVSVTLGDSVTLNTGLTVRRNDHVLWRFGPDSPDTTIAEIMRWSYMLSLYSSAQVHFRDQLHLDHLSGSLTIKNSSSEHSGLYKLTVNSSKKTFNKSFCLKVYAPLPVPIIISVSNSSSSDRSPGETCVLMCLVRNATWATLSFYKGGVLVSSISGSDLSSLSLPLELRGHEEGSYSCVVDNFISHHSTLFNTTDLCPTSRAEKPSVYCLLLLLLLIPVALTVALLILCICRKKRGKTAQTGEHV